MTFTMKKSVAALLLSALAAPNTVSADSFSMSWGSGSNSGSASANLYLTNDVCRYRNTFSKNQQRSKAECRAMAGCEWSYNVNFAGGGACQVKPVATSYGSSWTSSSSTSYTTTASTSTQVDMFADKPNFSKKDLTLELEIIQGNILSLWRNTNSQSQQRAQLSSLITNFQYGQFADQLFKAAVLDYIQLHYAGDEAAKAMCRCSCCCACWLGMCAAREWDLATQNLYYHQFLSKARSLGYITSDLGNLYARGLVVYELRLQKNNNYVVPTKVIVEISATSMNYTPILTAHVNNVWTSLGDTTYRTYKNSHWNMIAARNYRIDGYHYTIYDSSETLGCTIFQHIAGSYLTGRKVTNCAAKSNIKAMIDAKLNETQVITINTMTISGGADEEESSCGFMRIIGFCLLALLVAAALYYGFYFMMSKKKASHDVEVNDDYDGEIGETAYGATKL